MFTNLAIPNWGPTLYRTRLKIMLGHHNTSSVYIKEDGFTNQNGEKSNRNFFFFEVIRVMVRAMGNDVNYVVGIPAPCPRSKRFGDKSPFTKHRSMESVRCVGQKSTLQ